MQIENIISQEDPKVIFDLLQQIGAGSYGTVHQAFNLETSEIVAVKIVPLQEGESSIAVIKEVEFMKKISASLHPNLVNFLDAYHDIENNDLWIVMEYCSAGALTDLMRESARVLDEKEAAYVIKQSLQALKFLHDQKILHRDVKANNLLVSDDGIIKLADFGVSHQLTQTCEKRKSVIGTPYWMAPEIYQGEAYSYPSDIWALGITLIEILEGKPPLAGIHPMRAMMLIPQQDAPTLRGKKSKLTNKKFSSELCDFLEKMLVKNPDDRQTINVLVEDKYLDQANDLTALLDHVYNGEVAGSQEQQDSASVSENSEYDQNTVVQNVNSEINTIVRQDQQQQDLPVEEVYESTTIVKQIVEHIEPEVIQKKQKKEGCKGQ
ncbi:Kinase, STE STE20 [Spironucleus salmonicida]|uniref:non-specific serine/threonine protein kinase n=1 Tax=Spironucleus salmonicida TaxID=348837 RepID=V6LUI5_9EUKA|nr:Kinase, STE STE20 [Spironucleus salmonicida]|eukprot:EST48230.1 Kinase, STE STE20 [Spironucleus salmonicida]